MTENAETTEKVAKKTPARKSAAKKATKKAAARKPAAKKAATKRAAKPAATEAPKRRGRPPGTKTARKATTRRTKKGAKQFAYLLLTPNAESGAITASSISGPFSTEADALDDASIMADEKTTIVLFRETKRGRVQKSTKFVAGR